MVAAKRRVPRLFLARDLDGPSLALDERDAHYLAHVLRLQRGDEVVAFNGRGVERRASVTALMRRGAELALREPLTALPETSFELTLLQALPKNDAMDWVVQKATELGVRRIVPVQSEFSVVRLDAERGERRLEHWRRIARSACEQCGRHAPPDIESPSALALAVSALPDAAVRLALDPESGIGLGHDRLAPAAAVVAVGPEGGFGAEDWQVLDASGFDRVALGRRILRAETAAVAVCAIVQSLWGDL